MTHTESIHRVLFGLSLPDTISPGQTKHCSFLVLPVVSLNREYLQSSLEAIHTPHIYLRVNQYPHLTLLWTPDLRRLTPQQKPPHLLRHPHLHYQPLE